MKFNLKRKKGLQNLVIISIISVGLLCVSCKQTPDPSKNTESEFGDVLFSLINYARFINVDPESALEKTNKKFIQRFKFIEEAARKEGRQLTDMTLAEMDIHWEKSKTFFK